MNRRSHLVAALAGVSLLLTILVGLGVRNYDGRISALLHLYRPGIAPSPLPHGLVLYEDGGYDGMTYWLVARGLPHLLEAPPSDDAERSRESYRYQRVLLPLAGLVLAAGNENRLAEAFLAVNVAAVLLALALFVTATGRVSVHALALATNPAALLGVVFLLTEPLAILGTTAFLVSYRRSGERVSLLGALLLALALLARETTLFVVAPLVVLLAWKRQWRDAGFALASLVPFAVWSLFLGLHFGAFSLHTSSGMVNVPFSGPFALLGDLAKGANAYSLSALAFLVFVALPVLAVTAIRMATERTSPATVTVLLASLLGLVFCLDAHIWSALSAVGRVVPSLYPVFAFAAVERDGALERAASIGMIFVGIIGAVGVALARHPFTIS